MWTARCHFYQNPLANEGKLAEVQCHMLDSVLVLTFMWALLKHCGRPFHCCRSLPHYCLPLWKKKTTSGMVWAT